MIKQPINGKPDVYGDIDDDCDGVGESYGDRDESIGGRFSDGGGGK
jgi:hypothetical protein